MTGRSVLQVITDTDRRGPQVFATQLDAALSDRGWSVSTVALAPGRHERPLSVPTLGPARLHPRTLLALRRRIRETSAVVASGSTTLPASVLARARLEIPVVYRSIGDMSYWANTARRRLQTRLLLSRTQRVCVLWDAAVDTVADRFGVDRDQIRVIPTGVDPDDVPPVAPEERTRARSRLGLESDRPVIGYVGALTPEKNPVAVVELLGFEPTWQIVMAGSGPEENLLKARAERLGRGRATFIGTIDSPRLVYAASNVIVLPSLSEGTPGVLIEAGMAGVPAVSSSVGGIPHVVVDNQTGRLLPAGATASDLASAVRDVLRQADRFGAAAREHCREVFALDRVAAGWDELLSELVPA